MNKKGVSEAVSAVLLISLVIILVLTFSYIYTRMLYEKRDEIEGTVFEEIGLGCNPAYECSEWSQCKIDYNLEDLIHEDIQLTGISKRKCADSKECAPDKTEEEACSSKELIDISAVKEKGKEYIEIRDKKGKLVSKIDKNDESGTLYVDIYV
jgi:hypothetical protein